MTINEILTDKDIDSILTTSTTEYKKYRRDYIEYTVMYTLVRPGLLYFGIKFYFEGFQYLTLLFILYLISFSFTLNFNKKQIKKKKLCSYISNKNLVTDKAAEYVIETDEKNITINNTYSLPFKDVKVAFLLQNQIALVDKNNKTAIIKSDFEYRKYIVNKLNKLKTPVFTFDKTNENIILATRYAINDMIVFAISLISWILMVVFYFKFKKMYKLAAMAKTVLRA